MDTAHHILLYGCSVPGSSNSVCVCRNCGEMNNNDRQMRTFNPCKNGSQIIYAWARDAPKLSLPDGVGFKVGRDSMIQYLVLQVHYANIDKYGSTDNSGVYLYYTEKPMTKLAGVLLLGTSGKIPAMATEHMESSCPIEESKELHPFAFRTHTHSLGRVVAGYRVRTTENGVDRWTLLGKKNPLLPEMFYPVVNDSVVIQPNDRVAARCTMESNRTFATSIGPTNKDEMCNFYLMYWVEETEPLKMKYCFSPGPPRYYWKYDNFNHIPELDASTLD
ncbi:hypothetical protein AAG570_012994 [Ranatra chinensis]|uniref:peptidylglycine monooxygenase n=1 Tax=Ranatra chinensis TaxID=642074 RepID=A0ABD0YFH1_9HEMI